jgi:hypothetical protein
MFSASPRVARVTELTTHLLVALLANLFVVRVFGFDPGLAFDDVDDGLSTVSAQSLCNIFSIASLSHPDAVLIEDHGFLALEARDLRSIPRYAGNQMSPGTSSASKLNGFR